MTDPGTRLPGAQAPPDLSQAPQPGLPEAPHVPEAPPFPEARPESTPPPPDLRRDVRRLRRSRSDRVIAGVCGGLGRYLGVDPVLLRIAAVALALSGGLGLIAYIVAWAVIPEAESDEIEPPAPPATRHSVAIAVGAGLIGLGALLLVRQWVPWFGADLFWPIVVVVIGLVLVASARR